MNNAIFSGIANFEAFESRFPDDLSCRTALQNARWPNGIDCPRCHNEKVYPVANRPYHWQCQRCTPGGGYRFSVLVGTIFENTNVGLRDWFMVIHMMLTRKKPPPALEVQRIMGFGSYRTAHYMCRRIRAGLGDPDFRRLMGIDPAPESIIETPAGLTLSSITSRPMFQPPAHRHAVSNHLI